MQPTNKNLSYTCYIQSIDNNGDDLKTYVYKQTTISSQVLSTEWKNKTKLSLLIVNIKHHISSRDDNRDN